jgi:hypothetical protein
METHDRRISWPRPTESVEARLDTFAVGAVCGYRVEFKRAFQKGKME